mmetsp:Transcript_7478/g.23910  ORF Transcript_7478/g.23910 Transcript_7478/m.23910 type:complete len:230 (+) Transcript_7478:843-1532(+)
MRSTLDSVSDDQKFRMAPPRLAAELWDQTASCAVIDDAPSSRINPPCTSARLREASVRTRVARDAPLSASAPPLADAWLCSSVQSVRLTVAAPSARMAGPVRPLLLRKDAWSATTVPVWLTRIMPPAACRASTPDRRSVALRPWTTSSGSTTAGDPSMVRLRRERDVLDPTRTNGPPAARIVTGPSSGCIDTVRLNSRARLAPSFTPCHSYKPAPNKMENSSCPTIDSF